VQLASSTKETVRVICSSTDLFFRPTKTDQGSLKENLCGFDCLKSHRKAEE
jgi:hypothetical protein